MPCEVMTANARKLKPDVKRPLRFSERANRTGLSIVSGVKALSFPIFFEPDKENMVASVDAK